MKKKTGEIREVRGVPKFKEVIRCSFKPRRCSAPSRRKESRSDSLGRAVRGRCHLHCLYCSGRGCREAAFTAFTAQAATRSEAAFSAVAAAAPMALHSHLVLLRDRGLGERGRYLHCLHCAVAGGERSRLHCLHCCSTEGASLTFAFARATRSDAHSCTFGPTDRMGRKAHRLLSPHEILLRRERQELLARDRQERSCHHCHRCDCARASDDGSEGAFLLGAL